jgi:hypothetical protein
VSDWLPLVTAADDAGWIGRWSPGIGDPTPAGWLATLAYAVAAWSCWAAARRLRPEYRVTATLRREWRIWQALALLLAGLGLNKQLDLQSALTELGRLFARSQGWYAERRGVQLVFIALVAGSGLAAAAFALFAVRRTAPAVRAAVAGACALVAFVVARAASFHHADLLISRELLGLRLGSLVELAAAGTIIAATRWRARTLRR